MTKQNLHFAPATSRDWLLMVPFHSSRFPSESSGKGKNRLIEGTFQVQSKYSFKINKLSGPNKVRGVGKKSKNLQAGAGRIYSAPGSKTLGSKCYLYDTTQPLETKFCIMWLI